MFVTDLPEQLPVPSLNGYEDPVVLSAESQALAALEVVVQADPGARGVRFLHLQGELEQSVQALARASHVGITTGFPCNVNFSPPTEARDNYPLHFLTLCLNVDGRTAGCCGIGFGSAAPWKAG
jgi:hypothetical protein